MLPRSVRTLTVLTLLLNGFPSLALSLEIVGGPVITLTDPAGAEFDQFGHSIASDGSTIVVGSHGDDDVGDSAGSVFVYSRDLGGTNAWGLVTQLLATNPSPQLLFGSAVALDGDTLAVHAPGSSGGVSIRQRNIGGVEAWGELKYLPRPASGQSSLGRTVALKQNILVVGDSTAEHATVFERDLGGVNNWGQAKVLTPSAGLPGDRFGVSVSISGDTIIVGSWFNDGNKGAAYIYDRNEGGPGNWGEVRKLVPDQLANNMGSAVSVAGDIAVVAAFSGTTNPASAYIFERDAGGADNWGEVVSVSDPEAPGRGFLSATLHGSRLMAAANGGNAVVVFERDAGGPGNWGLVDRLPIAGSLALGWSIDFSDDVIAAGDMSNSQNGQEAGAAFVFMSQGRLELVDVNPTFLEGGAVVEDPDVLASGGVVRQGVAADGVTRLLLRYATPGVGSVEFALRFPAQAPGDGGLDVLGGDGRNEQVVVNTSSTPGRHYAFAVYRAPDEFREDGSSPAAYRDIEIVATFSPTSGPGEVQRATIKLARAPLVFLHGLWSSGTTWTLPLAADSRYAVRQAPSYPNSLSFSANSLVVFGEIRKALLRYRDQGIAATKADVIAHSMGGLLARIWTTHLSYIRNNNFLQGDLRKLITLDTPHRGSELADGISDLLAVPILSDVISELARLGGLPVDEGAVIDLATDSPEILGLEASPVPAHVVVGTGGIDALPEMDSFIGYLFVGIDWLGGEAVGSVVFDGQEHDGIVSESSQRGGLAEPAASLFGGEDGVHTNNTGSLLYSVIAQALLETPFDAPEFDQLPSSTGPLGRRRSRFPFALERYRAGTGSVVITSPGPGTIVAPGEVLSVVVEPAGGETVDDVLVAGGAEPVSDSQAPFELLVQVPVDAVGSIELAPFGKNMSSEIFFGESIELVVQQTAVLESLSIAPETPFLAGVGDSLQLSALGHFDDGVTRDLTSSSSGTTYSIDHPEIALVSLEGLLSAVGLGQTQVGATNSGVAGSVWILVADGTQLVLFEDGFESGDTSAWSVTVP